LGFTAKTLYTFLSHASHMSCPPRSPWFYLPNNIWRSVEIMELPLEQLSPISCHLTLFGPNILLRTLFSKPSIYACPLMWENKFHTHTKQLTELWFRVF
jgi:hypothetical protein